MSQADRPRGAYLWLTKYCNAVAKSVDSESYASPSRSSRLEELLNETCVEFLIRGPLRVRPALSFQLTLFEGVRRDFGQNDRVTIRGNRWRQSALPDRRPRYTADTLAWICGDLADVEADHSAARRPVHRRCTGFARHRRLGHSR